MQTFDLTQHLVKNDIQRWASFHDWFVGNHENGVVCRELTLDHDGNLDVRYRYFDRISECKKWAGI